MQPNSCKHLAYIPIHVILYQHPSYNILYLIYMIYYNIILKNKQFITQVIDSYRALYNYKPQNSDELELREGDVVFVMEKCDDGWYVGSSKRTGCFGTFPGNYVQRSI